MAKVNTSQILPKSEEVEVKNYSETEFDDYPFDEDPFVFWQHKQHAYPLLSCAVFNLLSTPASTAPVEQIFSTGSEATTGI